MSVSIGEAGAAAPFRAENSNFLLKQKRELFEFLAFLNNCPLS